MKFSSRYILMFVSCLFVGYNGFGQLVTATSQTPSQLVQNVLVGSGVDVTNVQYSGGADAIGSFNGTNTNLGLGNGIVLTTGTVKSGTGLFGAQEGPYGPNNKANAGMDNNTGGYQQLTAIAGADTYNATILEFDFVPKSDSVKFRYVFGSEEYPEFVNAGFNDVFAFFITGPGFGGTYNMATIPGTGGTPVTIDNVNSTTNAAYFVSNGDGSAAPQNGSSTYIQYDGFTTVIEANAQVQCGETYHLKIAIADVGDPEFDSGIFLEANSLTSPRPVEISSSLLKNAFNNQKLLAEGCEVATITVKRDGSQINQALSIPLSTGGTAIEGVDYSTVPQNIVFAPGQASVSFDIDVFTDNILENDETLKLILDEPDPCGNSNLIELDLIIREVDPLTISLANDTIFCTGNQVALAAIVNGGVQPYSYNWASGQTGQTITLSPAVTTPFSVTATDDCNSDPVNTSANVVVMVYDPFVLNISNDTAVLCPNTPINLYANASGGSGSDVYNWTVDGNTISTTETFEVSPYVTTEYKLEVTNFCGEVLTSTVEVEVLTDVLTVATLNSVLICKGDDVEIWAKGLGGLGDFSYFWPHSGENTEKVTVAPLQSRSYDVYVRDGCDTYSIRGTVDVKVTVPRADFKVASSNMMEGLPIQFENTSSGGVQWEWSFGNGEFSTAIVPSVTYDLEGPYVVQQVTISAAGCRDSISKVIHINPEFYFYAPNAFTADNDRFNSQYRVSVIGATKFHFLVFNRWGEIVFESFDPNFEWDGQYNGKDVPTGVYVFKCKVSDMQEQRHDFEGFITVLK
ncbi:MAG: choice-of-anchor L domain-containing protein [Crocinitomicaceae bacterium]